MKKYVFLACVSLLFCSLSYGYDALFTCHQCLKERKDYISTYENVNRIVLDEEWLYGKFGVKIINKKYYDSKGDLHRHSYSGFPEQVTCSNGHDWYIFYFMRCNDECKWPDGNVRFDEIKREK